MSYQRKSCTEFIGVDWETRQELVAQLNVYVNEGWTVEAHRLSADTTSGWTLYRRYIPLNEPLLERTMNVGKVYEILNHAVTNPEMLRAFDAAIKQAVRQELDEF